MNELLERRCVNLDRDVNAGIEKRRLSEEIARQTAEWEARGNRVEEVRPSNFIVHRPQSGTVINPAREEALELRVLNAPECLKSRTNESGWKGIIRDKFLWCCRREGKRFGRFETVEMAAKALLRRLDSIGYKYE